jgi:hypothetical protein
MSPLPGVATRAGSFGRRAVKFLVVRFGVFFHRVNGSVAVMWRRINRVDFELLRVRGIDDIVPHSGGHDNGVAVGDSIGCR